MKNKEIILFLFGISKCVVTGPVPCTLSCVQGSDCKRPTCTCPKGFSKHPVLPRLCNPICSEPCVNGTCIQPELCACKRGFTLNQNNKYECVSKCTTPCKNGVCLSPDVCTCKKGYALDRTNRFRCVPICSKGCLNGSCSSPEICSCNVGFTSDDSNKFKCIPKCSKNCINGECIAPDTCECKEGFVLDSNNIYKCVSKFSPVVAIVNNEGTIKKGIVKEGKESFETIINNIEYKTITKEDRITEGDHNKNIQIESGAADNIKGSDKRNNNTIIDLVGSEETANITAKISISPAKILATDSSVSQIFEPSQSTDEEIIRADRITENLEQTKNKVGVITNNTADTLQVTPIEEIFTTNEDISLKNIDNSKVATLQSKDVSPKDQNGIKTIIHTLDFTPIPIEETLRTNEDITLENASNSKVTVFESKDVSIKDEKGIETITKSTTNILEGAQIQTEEIFTTNEYINNQHFKNTKIPILESENISIDEATTENANYVNARKEETIENLDENVVKETTQSEIKENLDAYTKRSFQEIIDYTESSVGTSKEETHTTREEIDAKAFDDSKVVVIDLNQIRSTENIEEHRKVILDVNIDAENVATIIKNLPQEQTISDLQEINPVLTEETFTSNNELSVNSDTFNYQENTIKCNDGYVLNGVKGCTPNCTKGCINSFCSSPDVCTCMESFRRDPEDKHKCVSKCSKGCVNSVCVEEDKCLCTEGFIPDARDPFRCNKPEKSVSCAKSCVNGKCTAGDVCGCNLGYEKDPEDDSSCLPTCTAPCVDGRCVAPEVCQCHERFEFNNETKACDLKVVKNKSFFKSEAATLTRKICEETGCLMAAIGTSCLGNVIFRF